MIRVPMVHQPAVRSQLLGGGRCNGRSAKYAYEDQVNADPVVVIASALITQPSTSGDRNQKAKQPAVYTKPLGM
jgi:hypothetical protein